MNKHLLKLHITTEKSATLKETANVYVFRVELKADKRAIRQAVETAFGVKVADVHTLVTASKRKRVGRSEGRTQNWKKAFVKLQKGQVIADFENI